MNLRRWEEARASFERAQQIRLKLATQLPAVPYYQIDLGGSYCNMGSVLRNQRRPADSLDWFAKAISTLTPVFQSEPRDLRAKEFLRNSHWGRAESLARLGRHAEAVKDWEKAIELSSDPQKRQHRASRATSLAQVGRVTEAVAEVVELSSADDWNGGQWYNFAGVYAIASIKCADLMQEYADRAVEALRNAVKAGWNDAAHLANNKWLDPLRDRADFKDLVEEIKKKSPSPSGKGPSPDVLSK
jgi:tetratricopeptide (TPR) repeat protein